ncbi:MAG: flavin reductase family protein, partial [Saprospiraceae bacterium]|nr:flavin reductase family protein [Saprospiraceae bacterium]
MSGSTFDPSELDARAFYRLLAGTIAPRPICLASTMDQSGKVNLSPFSFFNVFSSDPPVLIFSPVNRSSDGSAKDTLLNLREVPEVVVNLVDYSMVQQMSLTSSGYPRGTNEFVKAGFTALESKSIGPPRVAEAPVSIECRVDRIIPLGEQGGAGNLVLAHVLLLHV